MSDVIFIAVMLAFFVLCALYVQLCDRMIGPDESTLAVRGGETDADGEPVSLVTTMSEGSAGVTT